MKMMLLLGILFAGLLSAEELLPELAPFVQAREKEGAALDEARAIAMAATRPPYLTALDAADKTATASGKVQVVAALSREREHVQKGGMAASFPTDLPKNLEPYRRTYLKAQERVDAEFNLKQKAVDATFLRSLGALQFKAAANPALAAQILAEKNKMVTGVRGPITDLNTGLANTRWKAVKGNGEWRFDDSKLNQTWRYETPEPDVVRIFWSENNSISLKLGRDGRTLMESGKATWELMTPEQK